MTENRWIHFAILTMLLLYIGACYFIFPSGDDYTYANLGRYPNFVNTVLHERERWNGRYISNFLVIGSPMLIGQWFQNKGILLLAGVKNKHD